MVCFITHKLKIPKSDLKNYVKYILDGIYSLGSDLNFSNLENKRIEIIKETDEYYEIKFISSTFIPIANVLPATLLNPGVISYISHPDGLYNLLYYHDKKSFQKIERYIKEKVQAINNDWPYRGGRNIYFEGSDLNNLIKDLTCADVIHKYFQLNNMTFLCVSERVPLLIKCNKNKLLVDISYGIIFDIDNGFTPNDLTVKLNHHFIVWQSKGDITAQIIPPNNLRDDMMRI